ncbi:MAG: SAM-dependent DNA methyltransferase [Deltaproteobacteria bacterium]|nr:SAM-dependent DNA methyltransferase [Deltaproteobacteria bacterium]
MNHPKLPSTGPEREALREKGQFWTPDWVAEAMVGYVIAGGSNHIFDPAVGAGAFFRAAKTIANEVGERLTLLGTEIYPDVLQQARHNGLSESDLANVQITDFILDPPDGLFKAIVANPPYIRHHRLPNYLKVELKRFSASLLGKSLDGRTGLHVYFLLRALQLLDVDGRLAFIMPADTCEGIFSTALWSWITKNYRLEAVVTFTPEASPFPEVDTNPIIFMIKNTKPDEHFLWAKCTKALTYELKAWALSGFNSKSGDALSIYRRELAEGLSTGFSREPLEAKSNGPILADFASVLRGIATGANEFFFLTVRQATALGITDEFLIPAIGRTRDVSGDELNAETLRTLEVKGRPTLLFSPDNRPIVMFPKTVQEYLKQGEAIGLHKRKLIATRHPWYKMEVRPAPPILFAYLGRRNARFIRNRARVVPLTGFLCVYPHQKSPVFVDKLWQVLRRPETIANLPLVGKSYGAGAIKVEPRALERLILPASVVSEVELHPLTKAEQLQFWYDS